MRSKVDIRWRHHVWLVACLVWLTTAVVQAQPRCLSQGDGLVCGAGGDPSTLYSRYQGATTVVRYCENGCQSMPQRLGVQQDQCRHAIPRPNIIIQAGHENTGTNCRSALVGAHGATDEARWTATIATCVADELKGLGYRARHVDANFNCDPEATQHQDAVVSVHYRGHTTPLQRGYFTAPVKREFDAAGDESTKLAQALDAAYEAVGVPHARLFNTDIVDSYYMKNHDLLDDHSKCGFVLAQDTPFALIEAGVGDPDGADHDILWNDQTKVCKGIVQGVRDYVKGKFGTDVFPEDENSLLRPPHAGPPRIMLVGDSITHGTNGDFTWRYRFYEHLRAKGAAFDFVGPFRGPLLPNPDNNGRLQGMYAAAAGQNWDDDHDATWGRVLWHESTDIESHVRAHQPDMIVVALGTNDLNPIFLGSSPVGAAENMRLLIRNARRANPEVDVLLVQIGQTGPLQSQGIDVPAYNRYLAQVAAEDSTASSRIFVADVEHSFNFVTDTYDQTHPNKRGEYVIAKQVADAVWTHWSYGGAFGPVPLPTPPPKPTNISVTPGTISSAERFRVTWARVDSPIWTEYRLQVQEHTGFGGRVVWASDKTTPNLSMDYAGPTLDTPGVYQVVVVAVDISGQEMKSDPVDFTVSGPVPPPVQVQNFRFSPTTIGQAGGFVATWDRVPSTVYTFYKVQLRTHKSYGDHLVWESELSADLTTTFAGPRLAVPGVYHVYIIARDWHGQETTSPPHELTVLEKEPAPLPPANVRVEPRSATLDRPFTVVWDRVPNPNVWTTYKVHVRTHPEFGHALEWESTDWTDGLNATCPAHELPQAGIYEVRVLARDWFGQESASAPLMLTVTN